MDTFEDRRRLGRHGTDIPSLLAVQEAIQRLIRRKWSGRSAADREDLESIVLEKYVAAFGRDRLPDGTNGQPMVPVAWLTKVITNAGIDAFRKEQARPADPIDFGNLDDPHLEARLFGAVKHDKRLSAVVADRTDLVRALVALGDAFPNDLQLIKLRLIEDKSLADVSVLVGKSEDTTRKAIQRATARLRDLLVPVAQVENASLPARRVARRT